MEKPDWEADKKRIQKNMDIAGGLMIIEVILVCLLAVVVFFIT